MFKKCQVVMLPSQKANPNLFIHQGLGLKTKTLCTGQGMAHHKEMMECGVSRPQHLYILSDEEGEEGDWCIDLYTKSIFLKSRVKSHYERNSYGVIRKIIATTDTSLKIPGADYDPRSKSGREWIFLPQPSQGFIKVFIEEYNKGNVITDVMVEYEVKAYADNLVPEIRNELKINPKDNTITIRKLKDSWSIEELQKLFDSYGDNLSAKIIWEDIKNL